MRLWRTVWKILVLAIAGTGIGFVYLVAVAPELLPAQIRTVIQRIPDMYDVKMFLLITAVMVALGGMFAIWVWRERGRNTQLADPNLSDPNRNVPVAAPVNLFDSHSVERSDLSSGGSIAVSLREVLITAYEPTFDTPEAAEAYVDGGEWTEDPYAAAFLSTSESLDYPFLHRIVAWLYPKHAQEKRISRALREVERRGSEQFSLYDPPPYRRSRFERLVDLLKRRRMGDQK